MHSDIVSKLLTGSKYLDLLPLELQVDYLIGNYFALEETNRFIQEVAW